MSGLGLGFKIQLGFSLGFRFRFGQGRFLVYTYLINPLFTR